MMRGDFPPSSRETFFRLLTAQLEEQRVRGLVSQRWGFRAFKIPKIANRIAGG